MVPQGSGPSTPRRILRSREIVATDLDPKRPDQFCSVDQGIYGHLTRRNWRYWPPNAATVPRSSSYGPTCLPNALAIGRRSQDWNGSGRCSAVLVKFGPKPVWSIKVSPRCRTKGPRIPYDPFCRHNPQKKLIFSLDRMADAPIACYDSFDRARRYSVYWSPSRR